MAALLSPALYALLVWFFGTGVVLMLDNLPRRTFPWSMALGTLLFAISLHRLGATAYETGPAAAYAAFMYAVIAWAWQEMAFYMGFITGPRRTPAAQSASAATRFRAGLAASLWHELAIVATAAIILALTWRAPNHVGLNTFLLLWLMRTSAKLNVVLGVLNLGEEFIPAHLRYLLSFMARRPMNPLMPLSITLGTIGAVLLAQSALRDPGQPGLAMLATMLALAVIEHWFLVLPLPFARLWAWSLRFKPQPGAPRPVRGSRHGLPALLP